MTAFFDLVRDIPSPFDMVVLLVVIFCVSGVVTSLVKQVRVYADHEADRRLKREMMESGVAADDAERILRTTVAFKDQGESV